MRYASRIVSFVVLICSFLASGCDFHRTSVPTVNILISPYQDLAMLVNAKPLGLEKKYGVDLNIETVAWENIIPTVGSASNAPTIGFASYTQYLTEESRLNPPGSDPIVFIYPAYVFNGGAFVTFNPAVPQLTVASISNKTIVRQFLSYKIGVQKGSLYEMMIYTLADQAGVDPKTLHLVDMPLNTALLASEKRSIDIGEAGLTQETEAIKEGGKVVVTMDAMGFADLTGFICKQSFLSSHPDQVKGVMDMWFDSVNYVMSDIDHNSGYSLAYLKANAATQYSLEAYKQALAQEYFPKSPTQAYRDMVSPGGQYSAGRIGTAVAKYLLSTGQVQTAPQLPSMGVAP